MSTAPIEEPPDFGHAAHVAACARLSRCWEQLDAEEESPDPDGDGDAPGVELDTAGPFCGCQDCEVREVLHAAFPVLRAGLVDHLLTAGRAEAAHELMRAF